jgi:hypothetical protein
MTVKRGAGSLGPALVVHGISSQLAEKLTVSRDNTFERTPTSIEADMNS